jgi:coenzyme PQQ biosynthesis protein PqqD
VIDLTSVVSLSQKARLRFDRHSRQHMLLYPERGLVLNASAAEVVLACREARAIGGIIEQLVVKYGEEARDSITRDVIALLDQLLARGLLQVQGGST